MITVLHLVSVTGQLGQQGAQGIGFKLTSNGDYDIENKNSKTSLLDGSRTGGYIVNDKAVVYSGTGAVHAKSLSSGC